jgi:hypothetical protein
MSSCQIASKPACRKTYNARYVIYKGPNLPSINTYTNDNLTDIIISIAQVITTFTSLTASNIGGGIGIFSAKVGNDLQFKSLVNGSNISITQSGTEITITSSGGGGSTSPTIVTVNSSIYNANQISGEIILLVDTTIAGGNVTINLPTAIGNTAVFTIKKVDGGSGIITIDPFASQTIDLSLDASILYQNTFTTIISDSSNWKIIG